MYLKQLGYASRPLELTTLDYPTINDYTLELGGNPLAIITKRTDTPNTYEYLFTGVSLQLWTYYSMALYQYTWGLTDIRKSEFEVRVEADEVDKDYLKVLPIADPRNNELRPVVTASKGSENEPTETAVLEDTKESSTTSEQKMVEVQASKTKLEGWNSVLLKQSQDQDGNNDDLV